MSTNAGWGNANEGRGYPIFEGATRIDDTGIQLPDSILVDMGIVLPAAYPNARIGSIYISPDVVSVAISSGTEGLLTGTFSRNGLLPYRAYPLSPVLVGASGWAAFGTYKPKVMTRFIFSTPEQSRLESRICRVVAPPGVAAVYSQFGGMSAGLDGIIPITATGGLVVESDPDNPSNIIIRLEATAQTRYAGPCGVTASEERCAAAPIRYINNVSADGNGLLKIRFE